MAKERASDLDQLTDFIEDGRVIPAVADSYPLAHAKDAMRLLEAGKVRGKVVILTETAETDDASGPVPSA